MLLTVAKTIGFTLLCKVNQTNQMLIIIFNLHSKGDCCQADILPIFELISSQFLSICPPDIGWYKLIFYSLIETLPKSQQIEWFQLLQDDGIPLSTEQELEQWKDKSTKWKNFHITFSGRHYKELYGFAAKVYDVY